MRKIICMILTALAVCLSLPFSNITAKAADDMTFSFDLTVDGKDTKEVQTGDIITVVLKLKRTDATDAYTMNAMQDELRYDSTFLELVEGSAVLSNGIVSTDIAMVDQYREFYMNYLSMSGGTQWNADMLIGSVQFKVIGESGVTKITNQDYLVSLRDGTGSYKCDANEVTIVLSTECTVSFNTNGGSEITDQTVQFGEKINCPENPIREGYKFEGWYRDIYLSEKWDFEKDTVQGNLSLYAKWSKMDGMEETESDGNIVDPSDNTSDSSEDNSGSVSTGDSIKSGSFTGLCLSLILILLMILLFFKQRKEKNV